MKRIWVLAAMSPLVSSMCIIMGLDFVIGTTFVPITICLGATFIVNLQKWWTLFFTMPIAVLYNFMCTFTIILAAGLYLS
ncbi:hypothetical protein D3C78_19460 [compost metagenome]